jgi:hypothetical protein
VKHILTECQYPGRKELWELAKAAWEKKGREWPYITLGLIIGSTQVSFPSLKDPSKPDAGATRLFRLLIVEIAYLIWLLRNERVIQHGNTKTYSKAEIRNKFRSTMNLRLTQDRLLTNRFRYGTKAISPHLVKRTWQGLLVNEGELPREWTKRSIPGVLVSMEQNDHG